MAIKFYSQAEEAEIKKMLLEGNTPTEVSTFLQKKFKRSSASIIVKACKIRNSMNLPRKTKKSTAVSTTSIPKGMKLEFPASKISIENNRIIIYL